jgi:hypothetical protein
MKFGFKNKGKRIVKKNCLFLVEPRNGMVDSIGLSIADYASVPAEHRSIYFSDASTMRSIEDIITNIEASEYLNDGGELVGTVAKGYAQYADGTEMTKAYRYFRFYTGAMVFSFSGGENAEPSATNVESSTLTIPNISVTKSYTVTGGTASKNGGAWGASGSVVAGDTIKLRGNASASFETATTVTLSFGAEDSVFTITTRAAITAPTSFTFTDATGKNLSTVVESDAITVAGLEATASFIVAGGTAEKNDSGTWAASGTVENDDTVKVRGTSSASYSTTVFVVLDIGGVTDTFSITTKAEPVGGGSEYDLTVDDEALTIDLETLTINA